MKYRLPPRGPATKRSISSDTPDFPFRALLSPISSHLNRSQLACQSGIPPKIAWSYLAIDEGVPSRVPAYRHFSIIYVNSSAGTFPIQEKKTISSATGNLIQIYIPQKTTQRRSRNLSPFPHHIPCRNSLKLKSS
jgi:hypothetical protein